MNKKETIKEEQIKQPPEDNQNSLITQLIFLDALDSYIEKRVAKKLKEMPFGKRESEITKDINAALSKAQGEFKTVSPNRAAHHNDYADLDAIVMFARPILSKNGLSVTQEEIPTSQGDTFLKTMLRHNSGQWISSCAKIVQTKPGDQGYGMALSYRQRYSYKSLLNITTAKEIDIDDHDNTSAYDTGAFDTGVMNTSVKDASVIVKPIPKNKTIEKVTKEQLEELEYELFGHDDIAETVLDKLKIQSLADMPKTRYMSSIKRIKEIKDATKIVD